MGRREGETKDGGEGKEEEICIKGWTVEEAAVGT